LKGAYSKRGQRFRKRYEGGGGKKVKSAKKGGKKTSTGEDGHCQRNGTGGYKEGSRGKTGGSKNLETAQKKACRKKLCENGVRRKRVQREKGRPVCHHKGGWKGRIRKKGPKIVLIFLSKGKATPSVLEGGEKNRGERLLEENAMGKWDGGRHEEGPPVGQDARPRIQRGGGVEAGRTHTYFVRKICKKKGKYEGGGLFCGDRTGGVCKEERVGGRRVRE